MPLSYVKTEMKLGFKEGKPVVYKLAQQTIPAVTFQQLTTEVATSCGVNATMTKAVVEGMIDRLCHFMELGHAVQMGEFGTFKPVFNVKTQKEKDDLGADNITAKKIRFYAGKRFKKMLNDLPVVNQSTLNSVGEMPGDGETPDPSLPNGGGDDGGADFS